MRRSSWLSLLVVLLVSLGIVPVALAAGGLTWNRSDVEVQVNPDGTLTVTETYDITFGNQAFHKGFATIPQKYGSIGNVQVSEGDRRYVPGRSNQPYTFETSTAKNGDLQINWYFPYTSNSTHTFNLQYTVNDGLLYYPSDGYDRLQWIGVPGDHDYPILASRVTVRLPPGAPALRAGVASGSPANYRIADPATVVFESTGPLQTGQGIELRLDFQHGAVAGTPPAWQAAYDFQQRYGALIDVVALFLGAFVAVGGVLLILVRWYTQGRDPQTVMAAEYLSEPPSKLPPGVVGTLVDEQADVQDVIATLIDLARRGYVTMEEVKEPSFLGLGTSQDFVFRRVPQANTAELRGFEQHVLNEIIPQDEQKLSNLRYKFYNKLPMLKSDLYREVVNEKLFLQSPEAVRTRWGCLSWGLVIIAIVAAVAILVLLSNFGVMLALPFCGLGLVGIVAVIVARFMPKKTRLGAEEAAKWRAFRHYMQNLDKYTQVQEATDQFEKYLPYAIAFGIDRSWINRFARVPAMPVPIWYFPHGHYRGGFSGGVPSAGGELNVPSMQGMSDGLAGSFQGMSNGLAAMLTGAASTFTSVPRSSGGGHGWSGGGFSGGFSGGGGARGFG